MSCAPFRACFPLVVVRAPPAAGVVKAGRRPPAGHGLDRGEDGPGSWAEANAPARQPPVGDAGRRSSWRALLPRDLGGRRRNRGRSVAAEEDPGGLAPSGCPGPHTPKSCATINTSSRHSRYAPGACRIWRWLLTNLIVHSRAGWMRWMPVEADRGGVVAELAVARLVDRTGEVPDKFGGQISDCSPSMAATLR